VGTDKEIGRVYVAAAGSKVCLIAERAGGTCNSVDQLIDGTLLMILEDHLKWQGPDDVRVTGVVPDATTKVAVEADSGRSEQAAVVNNVYSVDAASDPARVVQTGRSERPQTTPVP
jgi:hypothetical protein